MSKAFDEGRAVKINSPEETVELLGPAMYHVNPHGVKADQPRTTGLVELIYGQSTPESDEPTVVNK